MIISSSTQEMSPEPPDPGLSSEHLPDGASAPGCHTHTHQALRPPSGELSSSLEMAPCSSLDPLEGLEHCPACSGLTLKTTIKGENSPVVI